MVVGHADLVTCDWVGNSNGHGMRRSPRQPAQVGPGGVLQCRIVGTGQHPHIGDGRTRRGLPGEAGVGSTNIGEQAG